MAIIYVLTFLATIFFGLCAFGKWAPVAFGVLFLSAMLYGIGEIIWIILWRVVL
jgi:hypothetical protein